MIEQKQFTNQFESHTADLLHEEPRSAILPKGRVLVVRKSTEFVNWASFIGSDCCAVDYVDDANHAVERLSDRSYGVLLVTNDFPEGLGIELAIGACAHNDELAAIAIYDDESMPEVVSAIRLGTGIRFFPKNTPPSTIGTCLKGLIETKLKEDAKQNDRREFPRVLPEGVALVAPRGSVLIDIAPGGIALRSSDALEIGHTFSIALRLGRVANLRMEAAVVRAGKDLLGRVWIAAKFVEPSERAKRLILGLIRRQMAAQGPREMQRRFRESSSVDIVPISATSRINEFLRRTSEQGLEYTLQGALGGSSWRAKLHNVDAATGRFSFDAPSWSAALLPGQILDFLLYHDYDSYLFEARVVAIDVEHVHCDLPHVIYYSEKRSRLRHSLEGAGHLFASVADPRRPGEWIRFAILDISDSGASFEANLDETLIFPGTVFDPLAICVGETESLRERAEVRHVTMLDNSKNHKIGVRFASTKPVRRGTGIESLRSVLGEPAAVRVAAKSEVVKFINDDGEELVALLNRSVIGDGVACPVVVILPAWGHSKESFCAYALSLIETFNEAERPVAVLRIDYSHHKGESYVPPEDRIPGRETLHFTFSHAVRDAASAIDFCFNNPLFTPSQLILVAPSFNGQIAMRVVAHDSRVSHLILPMSTPSTQELIRNASGGLDYLGGYQLGMRFGVVDFLGLLVDMDAVAADANRNHLSFVNDAQEDLRRLDVPITWMVGEHDAWINPSQVQRMLECSSHSLSEVVKLPVGHLPTLDEGLVVALEVTRTVLRSLGIDEEHLAIPAKEILEATQREEWARAPTAKIGETTEYWSRYLLGENHDSLGYDALALTDAYQDFAQTQISMLELGRGHSLLDAGAGTGQFAACVLRTLGLNSPFQLDLIDLIPEALERAKRRLVPLARTASTELRFNVVNLEVSALKPVARWLSGEFHSISCLRGRIRGLSDDVVNQLIEEYRPDSGWLIHAAIRGHYVGQSGLRYLDDATRKVVLDLGRAARLLTGQLRPDDFLPQTALAAKRFLGGGADRNWHAGDVRFESLEFGNAGIPAPLGIQSECYDRVVASLVLPYLLNPDETLAEMVRALRPGGIMVVSTMKPDTDISKLQLDLIEKATSGRIESLDGILPSNIMDEFRSYASSAAFLLRLTEEGRFRFMPVDRLRRLMSNAGLVDVKVQACFGDPPQAYVASGVKSTKH